MRHEKNNSENVKLNTWLQTVAAKSKRPDKPHVVFFLKGDIELINVSFKEDQWYVLPENAFNQLKRYLAGAEARIKKDFALTKLIDGLIKNQWHITREQLHDIFIEAVTINIFQENVVLCDSGHSYNSTSIDSYYAANPNKSIDNLIDFTTKEPVIGVASNKIINSLSKFLNKNKNKNEIKSDDYINLSEWFSDLKNQSIGWVAPGNAFPKRVVPTQFFSERPDSAALMIANKCIKYLALLMGIALICTIPFARVEQTLGLFIWFVFLCSMYQLFQKLGDGSFDRHANRVLHSISLWVNSHRNSHHDYSSAKSPLHIAKTLDLNDLEDDRQSEEDFKGIVETNPAV